MSKRMAPEREAEIREDIDSAEEWADFADDGECGLDGNDAWEWYANEGPGLLRAGRELLAELEAVRRERDELRERLAAGRQ